MSEVEFFRHMRVRKETFDLLIQLVKPSLDGHHRGRRPVGATEALQMGLWYLGTQATLREISQVFGVAEATVYRCVSKIVNSIVALGDRYIKWPTGHMIAPTEARFKAIVDFPGILGAIDRCHIPIKPPVKTQADYINRCGKHTVNLMAVCNADKVFTFIHVGCTGSAHDSRVFRYTDISTRPELFFPSGDFHIIGDSAFTLSTHTMIPYRDSGNITPDKVNYNSKLSKSRIVIEHSFGLLKGRFRRLKFIDTQIEHVADIISACCILHNITIQSPQEEAMLVSEGCTVSSEDHDEVEVELPPVPCANVTADQKKR